MPEAARLVGSLTTQPTAEDWEGLARDGDLLEWRADLLGEPGSGRLRNHFGGPSIYTLRSRAEGGESSDDSQERHRRLTTAVESFDFVDLEAERDLVPEVLSAIPVEKRIVSWHGVADGVEDLDRRLASMSETPAQWYKLIPHAAAIGETLAPLAFLCRHSRTDVISFAAGEVGTWTRLLAPRVGAPVVYGQVGLQPAAPGQLQLDVLKRDYGLPELNPVSRLFGIAGHPVAHSLSPRIHNRMYRDLGLNCLFVPFEVPIFGDFWLDLVEQAGFRSLGLELSGLAITSPFKEIAMAVAGAASPLAEHLSAANTLVRRGDVWEAESTDPEGVAGPLRARGISIGGRRAAVVGAGGAGRAAVFALAAAGAETVLVNRGRERGQRVARQLQVDFAPLDRFDPGGFDLVVNATPAGAQEVPNHCAPDRLGPKAVVIDLAYRRGGLTELVRAVAETGRTVIDGREVLLYQAVPQFRAMTGKELDLESLREELGLPSAGGTRD